MEEAKTTVKYRKNDAECVVYRNLKKEMIYAFKIQNIIRDHIYIYIYLYLSIYLYNFRSMNNFTCL